MAGLVLVTPVTAYATSRAHGAAPRATAHAAVSSDFDGDGVPDLAVGAPDATLAGHSRTGYVWVRYSKKHGGSRVHRLKGNARGELFGAAVVAGDFNGDGFDDLAVGEPGFPDPMDASLPPGAVRIYNGGATGLHFSGTRIDGRSGFDTDGDLGHALAAGDINGDGFDDVAIGNPGYGDAASGTGGVEVHYGSHSGITGTGAQFFYPSTEEAAFGTSLAIADVDGDHHKDLVVGIPTAGFGPGRIEILFGNGSKVGPRHQFVRGGSAHAPGRFGVAVAARDIDHDGHADVAVGAPTAKAGGVSQAGKVVVLFGRNHGVKATDREVISEATSGVSGAPRKGDRFGAALAIGAVRGGSFADLVVGAPGVKVHGHAHAGAVYLFKGASHHVRTSGTQRWTERSPGVPLDAGVRDTFGEPVRLIDVTVDGHADLLAGAPGKRIVGVSGAGAVVQLRGSGRGFVTSHARAFTDQTFGGTGAAYGSAVA